MRPSVDEAEASYRRPSAPLTPVDGADDLFAVAAHDQAAEAVLARIGGAMDAALAEQVRDAVLARHQVRHQHRLDWLRDRLVAVGLARAAAGEAPEVTGDDAWALWQAHPAYEGGASLAWMGSVFRGGRFQFTGRWVRSARITNKASDLRVWRVREAG